MSGTFGHTRHLVARKEHRCEECGRKIAPGEKYDRHAGKWEGDFFTNVACAHCAVLRRMVNDVDDYYYECYFGGLGEWVSESYPETTAGDFTSDLWLARSVRDFRRNWRNHDGTLLDLPDTWIGDAA